MGWWHSIVGDEGIEYVETPPDIVADANNSTHMLGSFLTERTDLLTDGQGFVRTARDIVEAHGATVMDHVVSQFTDDRRQQLGFTAGVVLAESHIAIHTWPELGMAEMDVYLCNVLRNNRETCRQIFHTIVDSFSPSQVAFDEVSRFNLASANLNGVTT